ncbi:MAG TPA: PspC domain-containing protein, partial [Actinophytocola sp.]|nr:PspC domain-containing protein [Actinophytocola sp.]
MVVQVMDADIERAAPRTATVPADDVVKMRRRRVGRAVAGVAGGTADHLDVKVLWVRLAFALLAAFGGAGVLAYGLMWVFVPQAKRDVRTAEVSRKERQQARGLLALGIGLAIGVGTLSDTVNGWVAGGVGVTLVGVALVWQEADGSARRRASSLVLG